jgi:carbohydrate-selective porin OprB
VPLLPWFSVQFDAQYIINPGTDPAVADALLVGLRCQFTF